MPEYELDYEEPQGTVVRVTGMSIPGVAKPYQITVSHYDHLTLDEVVELLTRAAENLPRYLAEEDASRN